MKVYGLMITGEPKRGNEFAYMSATNFRQQTHQNLELVIVNHSPHSIAAKFDNPSWINEVMVENNYTLGDLRNIALDQVPKGSWWVQWDDDDWHAETSIAKQLEFTISGNFIASLQCNMIYYDLRSDRAWQTHMCGIPATIMTTKTIRQ